MACPWWSVMVVDCHEICVCRCVCVEFVSNGSIVLSRIFAGVNISRTHLRRWPFATWQHVCLGYLVPFSDTLTRTRSPSITIIPRHAANHRKPTLRVTMIDRTGHSPRRRQLWRHVSTTSTRADCHHVIINHVRVVVLSLRVHDVTPVVIHNCADLQHLTTQARCREWFTCLAVWTISHSSREYRTRTLAARQNLLNPKSQLPKLRTAY